MQKARAVDSVVIWAVSIVLAGMFLLAGIQKLVGIEGLGLQAAAMRDFPGGLRVLVGLVEIAGAIGLLIPAVATFAALGLAILMIAATLTQYASGEPGLGVPILAMALLLFVAWRRNPDVLRDGYRGFARTPHPLLRDGIIAGVLGATAIAVWFLLVDTLAGRPFYTPATLGRGLLHVIGPTPPLAGMATYVVAYTVFHYAAFVFVGLVAALIVYLAQREPSILFGFLILFIMTELGIYGLVGLLDVATPFGRHAWYQIMAGNLLAAIVMGIYFWRTHRELADEFRHSLDGEPREERRPEPPPPDPLRPGSMPPSPGGSPITR